MRPARKALAAGLPTIALRIALAINTSFAGGGITGVHQHAVAAQLHRDRGIDAVPTPASTSTGTLALIDDQAKFHGLRMPSAGADQRGQRHDRDAADVFQHLRLDGVVSAGETTSKPSLTRVSAARASRACWGTGSWVAEYLQLDHQRVAIEHFARRRSVHRVVGGVAAGGVRQDGEFLGGTRQAGWVRRVLADVGGCGGWPR